MRCRQTAALIWLWRCPRPRAAFLPAIIYCANCAFLFGYHVHEKAALTAAVPMIILAAQSKDYARYVVVSKDYARYVVVSKDYARYVVVSKDYARYVVVSKDYARYVVVSKDYARYVVMSKDCARYVVMMNVE
jgi:hypothetical protein